MKKNRFALINTCFTIILLLSFNIQLIKAQSNAGEILIIRNNCLNINQATHQFVPGEWIYIKGNSFEKGTYNWYILKDYDGAIVQTKSIIASGILDVNDTGAFSFAAYQATENDIGNYHVVINEKSIPFNINSPGASVTISIGACTNVDGISTTEVTFILENALLNILGNTYDQTVTLYLEPGAYDYVWVAKVGFDGGACEAVIVEGCNQEPTPTHTSTHTATPTSTSTHTATPTSTQTQTLTSTPTKTATLTQTATATLTQTPTLTSTSTNIPTNTPTPIPTKPPITGLVGLVDVSIGLGLVVGLVTILIVISRLIIRKRSV